MIKILITGGAGNVGGALARKLVENPDYFVVIVDDLSTGSVNKLPKKTATNWSFVNCDVNNYQSISEIMLTNHFDYVFHYAAVVGVNRTQENPIMVLNDIDGIKNILQLSKNSSAIKLLETNINDIDWYWLSGNPNAIELLKANPNKINWTELSNNPNAIELLKTNQDKINWYNLSKNPSIFTYDYEDLTETTNI